jgi:hypothetical protein
MKLKALGKAFDDAWDPVSPHISDRAEATKSGSLMLADIVLGLAKVGNFDPQKLAHAAVQRMLAGPSRVRQ